MHSTDLLALEMLTSSFAQLIVIGIKIYLIN